MCKINRLVLALLFFACVHSESNALSEAKTIKLDRFNKVMFTNEIMLTPSKKNRIVTKTLGVAEDKGICFLTAVQNLGSTGQAEVKTENLNKENIFLLEVKYDNLEENAPSAHARCLKFIRR